jgi:putative addiction module component (TIGR02574 family)
MSVLSDLRARALELPEPERAALAHELILSLGWDRPELDPGYEEAWAAELEDRLRRYESGESVPIAVADVLARVHAARTGPAS